MATTYTIALANAKPGSIVVTPSTIGNPYLTPEYYLNLTSVKLQGDNPFLADGVTTNPNATISLTALNGNQKILTNVPISNITAIGGSATPATLVLILAALAALISE